MSKKETKENHCGASKSWIDVPDFCFTASCKKHDELYIKGGNENDRYVADWLFYQYMKQDAGRNPFQLSIALVFFKGVRLFGKKHFNYK